MRPMLNNRLLAVRCAKGRTGEIPVADGGSIEALRVATGQNREFSIPKSSEFSRSPRQQDTMCPERNE